MTCTGTRRFPRPKPFLPSMTDSPRQPPPALQPPSASGTPSCPEMQALSLSSASQSLRCKAASQTPTTADAAQASRQYSSVPPAFPQYPLGAVLPGPQPWGISQRPYVLSSLPHVMHQLLEESNTDFLQFSAPQADWPNQATHFSGQHSPAKKRCHAQQQQPAANQNSQAVTSQNHQPGASQHQTAVDTTTSHRQSARQQPNTDQGQAARLQPDQARRSAFTPVGVPEPQTGMSCSYYHCCALLPYCSTILFQSFIAR